jgi:hypothetical protein
MKKLVAALSLVAAAAAFLGFTTPGHHLLNTLGFATADPNGGCPNSGC